MGCLLPLQVGWLETHKLCWHQNPTGRTQSRPAEDAQSVINESNLCFSRRTIKGETLQQLWTEQNSNDNYNQCWFIPNYTRKEQTSATETCLYSICIHFQWYFCSLFREKGYLKELCRFSYESLHKLLQIASVLNKPPPQEFVHAGHTCCKINRSRVYEGQKKLFSRVHVATAQDMLVTAANPLLGYFPQKIYI